MIDKNEIIRLAEEQLVASSNYLVDVQVKPGNQIVVEIDNDDAVCIDDCVALSRHIEEGLNRRLKIRIEDGSAGITSPLKVYVNIK
jgi:ribosome maturation factor RimP